MKKSIALVFIALMVVGFVSARPPSPVNEAEGEIIKVPEVDEILPPGSYKVGGGGSDHSKSSISYYYDGSCYPNLWEKVKPFVVNGNLELNDEFVMYMTSEDYSFCAPSLWSLMKDMFM